jgi:hypothetical protein
VRRLVRPEAEPVLAALISQDLIFRPPAHLEQVRASATFSLTYLAEAAERERSPNRRGPCQSEAVTSKYRWR